LFLGDFISDDLSVAGFDEFGLLLFKVFLEACDCIVFEAGLGVFELLLEVFDSVDFAFFALPACG